MYLQCSFCGYLNEQRTVNGTTLLDACALCHELLRPDVTVGWRQFMQSVRPSCPACARELLLNNTCSYCTAVHATGPPSLLTRLSFFSEIMRALNMQQQPHATTAARDAGNDAQEERREAAPSLRPLWRQAPRDQAPRDQAQRDQVHQDQVHRETVQNIWQSSSTTLWTPRLSPPAFLEPDDATTRAWPVLNFTMIDFDTLLLTDGDEEARRDDAGESGGLSEHARASLLRAPVSVADDFMCGVCLAPAEGAAGTEESGGDAAAQLTELPCAHVFHANCVNQWFMNHRTCPMCRQLVTAARQLRA